jgi:hypothetical protein
MMHTCYTGGWFLCRGSTIVASVGTRKRKGNTMTVVLISTLPTESLISLGVNKQKTKEGMKMVIKYTIGCLSLNSLWWNV